MAAHRGPDEARVAEWHGCRKWASRTLLVLQAKPRLRTSAPRNSTATSSSTNAAAGLAPHKPADIPPQERAITFSALAKNRLPVAFVVLLCQTPRALPACPTRARAPLSGSPADGESPAVVSKQPQRELARISFLRLI